MIEFGTRSSERVDPEKKENIQLMTRLQSQAVHILHTCVFCKVLVKNNLYVFTIMYIKKLNSQLLILYICWSYWILRYARSLLYLQISLSNFPDFRLEYASLNVYAVSTFEVIFEGILEKQYTKRHGINIGCINNRTKVSKVYFIFVTKDNNPLFLV